MYCATSAQLVRFPHEGATFAPSVQLVLIQQCRAVPHAYPVQQVLLLERPAQRAANVLLVGFQVRPAVRATSAMQAASQSCPWHVKHVRVEGGLVQEAVSAEAVFLDSFL